jgi:hypothetical protein
MKIMVATQVTWLAVASALAVLLSGCNTVSAPLSASATPVAQPHDTVEPYRPLHHNIPATFVGQESGPIVYLCATALRLYEGHLEEDHYLQYEPCPATPIQ